jgi:hypothetical protein
VRERRTPVNVGNQPHRENVQSSDSRFRGNDGVEKGRFKDAGQEGSGKTRSFTFFTMQFALSP